MSDIVDQTLKNWRSSTFEWGKTDCLMSTADYVRDVTGIDHAAQWRGTYHDEQSANVHIEQSGGVLEMVRNKGLVETVNPERGDIVVVNIAGREIGGLCTGDSVAFRAERGVSEINMRFITVVGAWKV